MLKRTSRTMTFVTALALASGLMLIAAAPLQRTDDDLTLAQWSDLVWNSALTGNDEALQGYFSRSPQGFDTARLAIIRDGLKTYQVNREQSEQDRTEARDNALLELREHIANEEVSQALRSAVEYQTLMDNYDIALDVMEVKQIIATAKELIPQEEEKQDWLYAQELLYRLRTLYDDTSYRADYNKYDKQLKQLNRRIVLLQQYAPEQLYNLRNSLAQRLGEEPLPEYNPNLVDKWQERVRGVDDQMLKIALRATAFEHIEAKGTEGWRPLLDGGLKALGTVATTPALSEAFPGIKNANAVDRWINKIEEHRQVVAQTPDSKLSYRMLDNILRDLDMLNQQTINLSSEVLYREFGEGAMFELSAVKEDDYSGIIWPNEVRRFRQQTEGNFVGVGILIKHNERRDIVVVNPLEGTPAFRAGIRPEDIIVEVDGKPTVGWSLIDAVDRITGKRGTTVTLGIRRESVDGLMDFEIGRDRIDLPSVKGWYKTSLDEQGKAEWDWMIDPVNHIGYLRLTSFSEQTNLELRRAWREMKMQNVEGLILDLRHNPGGLLDQAVEVVNMFVSEGDVVSIEGKRNNDKQHLRARATHADRLAMEVPIAVLINKGSASASEIVSGALQAHNAALIVGTRSWGKGSVQRVFGISRAPNEAQLKLTTQYYRLPPAEGEEIGRLVHKRPAAKTWGVEPDVYVEMTPVQVISALNLREAADRISSVQGEEAEERPDVNDLINKGVDPQLATALLILQAKAVGKAKMMGKLADVGDAHLN